MADVAIASTGADASKAVDETTRTAETTENTTVAEAKPAGGDNGAPPVALVEEQAPQATAATDDEAAKHESVTAKSDATAVESNGDTTVAIDASAPNGAPASSKKANGKSRKSAGGIPEHKSKKTPSKKKTKELHLHTKPGDMWMVAMRGYQPWPVIICDEDMLPESLLMKRPVSAKRLDGTYREDFQDDGKNAKDRRFPIMFLGTNEFAWQVNYDLLPFNIEDVKKEANTVSSTKKNKALSEAYVIAAEGHDLDWFKTMLKDHEQAMQEDIRVREAKAEEKAKKADKAAKRKSAAAGDVSDDVEMEDAGDDAAPKKAKASKKRKKEDESEGEPEKPAKTPKQKLKLNNKPKDASATKPKKESKAKKSKVSEDEAEPAPVEEPPMTEAERLAKREKQVLYMRHRLQKGFLSRDQAPKEEEMSTMSDHLKSLEQLEDLEAEVIKNTKVHKVLKAILKLETIPSEELYSFKARSDKLLGKWNITLAAEVPPVGASTSAAAATPATNGVKHDSEKKPEAPTVEPTKTTHADGDLNMAETKDETPAQKPAAGSDAEVPVKASETEAA